MSVRLSANNSLIKLLIRVIFVSFELFRNHEFYSRIPGLTDVYDNGKIIVVGFGSLFSLTNSFT